MAYLYHFNSNWFWYIDLQTPDDGLAAATKRNEPDDGREEEEKLDSDGMDSQWNKRMKERLERIKSKKLRDTVSLLYLQFLSSFLPLSSSSHLIFLSILIYAYAYV